MPENPLRLARQYKRLSQEQLAQLAGVTTKTIARAETGTRGRRNVSDATWRKIAAVLDTIPNKLYE